MMGYRVAVGSRDGKVVNEHFGRCKSFLIFFIDAETNAYKFEGIRKVIPICNDGEHNDADFESVINILSDCRIVLISKIGPAAENILSQHSIEALESPLLIEDALQKIIKFYK